MDKFHVNNLTKFASWRVSILYRLSCVVVLDYKNISICYVYNYVRLSMSSSFTVSVNHFIGLTKVLMACGDKFPRRWVDFTIISGPWQYSLLKINCIFVIKITKKYFGSYS